MNATMRGRTGGGSGPGNEGTGMRLWRRVRDLLTWRCEFCGRHLPFFMSHSCGDAIADTYLEERAA